MLSSRTVLNGGEREQEHVIGASEEGLQARANLNGGELGEGPILPEERAVRCVMCEMGGAEDSAQPKCGEHGQEQVGQNEKNANKQINKNQLNRRRRWQKSVGSKLVQGEDRKERVANRELCR